MTIIPPFLKSGDTIGIAATARWITPEQLQPALDLIHSWGFRTKLADNIHEQRFQLAGDAARRTECFQRMLDDDEIQAIVIVRGGYGTVHIVDQLDFSKFEQHPKWICGYSDITVLLSEMYARGIACIHSTMPISFPVATPEALENLRKTLTGELREITWSCDANTSLHLKDVQVTGGNLSVIYSLLGSSSLKMPDESTIVFMEDVDEMYYHIDRMLMGLMRAGYFSKAKAILVGGMTMMKDNTKAFGFETENPWGDAPEITIQRLAERLQIPVVFGFPAGHQNDNRAFYMGVKSELIVKKGKAELRTYDSSY